MMYQKKVALLYSFRYIINVQSSDASYLGMTINQSLFHSTSLDLEMFISKNLSLS